MKDDGHIYHRIFVKTNVSKSSTISIPVQEASVGDLHDMIADSQFSYGTCESDWAELQIDIQIVDVHLAMAWFDTAFGIPATKIPAR